MLLLTSSMKKGAPDRQAHAARFSIILAPNRSTNFGLRSGRATGVDKGRNDELQEQ